MTDGGDPDVPAASAETLERLMATQVETPQLDFKETLNLDSKIHAQALAKDIAAMSALGGHIVVGTNERGQPSGLHTDRHRDLLDESRLRAKVGPYLPSDIGFRSAWHDVGGQAVTLIAVERYSSGVCLMACDGNNEKGKAFQAGDVFVRRGTSTVRANRADMETLIGRVRNELRESVRVEVRQEWQSAATALIPQAGHTLPVLEWPLDLDAFTHAVAAHLLHGKDVGLRRLLIELPRETAQFARGSRGIERTGDILDRAAVILTQTMIAREDALFHLTLRQLGQAYDRAVEDRSPASAVPAPPMGMMMLERLQAIGALTVRAGHFDLTQALVLQSTRTARRASPLWIMDMQRRATSADLYRDGAHGGGAPRYVWPLSRARDAVQRNSRLAPDVLPDDEYLMTSLCEFAFLADLLAVDRLGSHRAVIAGGNFAGWYSERTDPIVVDLLDPESNVRQAIFPKSNAALAEALTTIREYAARSGSVTGPPWDGYEDRQIIDFLREFG